MALTTLLKIGAKGIVYITEYIQRPNEEKQILQIAGNPFEIKAVRSREFIIAGNFKSGTMHCKFPQNKKDGSETWQEMKNGFERTYHSVQSDGIKYEIGTIYLFDLPSEDKGAEEASN